ncbi:MAG: hypothetical protein OER95_12165 [Acidimicrobiia bacterium]|nr:hypothetical protein [Acidimicrobiia bacterium]
MPSTFERVQQLALSLPEAGLPKRLTRARWEEVEEPILTSYTMVAPKTRAHPVLAAAEGSGGV